MRLATCIKREPVLSIALVIACISMVIVPPSKEYLSYIDWKTLGCLYALMLVVAGFRKQYLFTKLSTLLLSFAKTPRSVSAVLVGITFFTSALITNDVALLTFVPLTIVLFSLCNERRPILMTIVLQTVAANVGSSLTPVGNPQNLFLYTQYDLSLSDFFMSMAPYGIAGAIALVLLLFFIPSRSSQFSMQQQEVPALEPWQIFRYGILFVLSLAAVFDLLPWLLVVVVVTIASDKRLLRNVDYSLLLTFIGFFIFVGNIGQIELVQSTMTKLLKGREFYVSLLASQVLSNVPATIFLSRFSEEAILLLKGVNAGGCGTLIASMASVISFKIFSQYDNAKSIRYLALFTLVNILFVALFIGVFLLF